MIATAHRQLSYTLLALGLISCAHEPDKPASESQVPLYGSLPVPLTFAATPAGGTFVAGILQLELPPGAVGKPTTISVSTQGDSYSDGLPATAVYTLEPSGLVFSTPIRAQLVSPPALGPDEEVVVYLSDNTGEQELLSSQEHDGHLVFAIPHFSNLAPEVECTAADRTPTGCGTKDKPCQIKLSAGRYPQTARHVRDVIAKYPEFKSLQLPTIVKPDETADERAKAADGRRSAAMRAFDAERKVSSHCCLARDEYPLAMTAQGGACAHVRLLDFSENSGSGTCIHHRIANLNPGEWFELEFVADSGGARTCKHLPALPAEEKTRYKALTEVADDFYRRLGCPADAKYFTAGSGGSAGMVGGSGAAGATRSETAPQPLIAETACRALPVSTSHSTTRSTRAQIRRAWPTSHGKMRMIQKPIICMTVSYLI